MNCLVIGGGRFLGAKVVEELVDAKHKVAFLDPAPLSERIADRVKRFGGDKGTLAFCRDAIADFAPEVVAHLNPHTAEDISVMLETMRGVDPHYVIASNTNVYLTQGRFRQTEPGPSLAVPVAEGAPLRNKPLKEENQGDKRGVETILARAPHPSTILRLAPLYGPHDYFRRFYPLMVRMIDERPRILLGASQADWKWTHAFVDDAAHAVALAMGSPSENKRVFNVGERSTPSMKERIEHIGTVFGWEGKVSVVPDEKLPDYLRTPGDFAQDLEIDSSLIRKELDYKERADYYDGLAAAIDWYRSNPPPKMAGRKFSYQAEDAVLSEQ